MRPRCLCVVARRVTKAGERIDSAEVDSEGVGTGDIVTGFFGDTEQLGLHCVRFLAVLLCAEPRKPLRTFRQRHGPRSGRKRRTGMIVSTGI